MARGSGGTWRAFELRNSLGVAVLAVVALLAVAVPGANGATRFAAPGGNGPAPCLKSNPCSLFLAASNDVPIAERAQGDDEVIVLPGEYSGPAGELGPGEEVQLPTGVDIHGEAGSQKPILSTIGVHTALVLNGDSVASDLEVNAPNSWAPLWVGQSSAERLVAKTGKEFGIACEMAFRSILRDSICIATGKGGVGVGQRVSTNPFPMNTRTLRNVTAIASGLESQGILFRISGGEVFVDVKSSIAQGTASDVEAVGREVGGGSFITLENSDFATSNAVQESGGSAFTTGAGTNGNITAPPLLNAWFHQLPNSPTVDKGVLDPASGASDIDGNARVIRSQVDIGADEWALPTATTVACSPTSLWFGEETSCAVLVEAEELGAPGGAIDLAVDSLKIGGCALVPSGPNQARCETHLPLSVVNPNLQLTAEYRPDPTHAESQGQFGLAISPVPTAATLDCAEHEVLAGQASTCRVAVSNVVSSSAVPSGSISFRTTGIGISIPSSCALVQVGPLAAGCQVTYTGSASGGGSHELEATYPGDVGHSTASARVNLVVRSAPKTTGNPSPEPKRSPETVIRRKPPRRTSHRSATILFTSSEEGSGFQCRLDSRPFRLCQSPLLFRVKRGPHTFRVRAIGEAGPDPSPAAFSWVVTARDEHRSGSGKRR